MGELLAPLEQHQWQPTVVRDDDQPVVYGPYPVTHRGTPEAMPSMSLAIDAFVQAQASADPYAAAKRPVREAIARARSRLERQRQALQRSLHKAKKADLWRQWGEWILAYAHTIHPGQTELLADTGQGEPLAIPLDPAQTAADNAQTYFARYRKAQRAAEAGPARLQKVQFALRDLDQLETDLELASSRPEIEEVRAALIEAGHLQTKKRKAPKPSRSQPLSLTSPDGIGILIGRNSRQNDQVTFRRATGDHWWFHVRGAPGSHVIVRSEQDTLPPGTIQRAAELAAHFSRYRDEAEVQVDYTRRRYVRRIPKAAPGLVTYEREQSIRVRPRGPG
jgi:predicted ribosome quality control (RQC) complex YloA/Tae2 family protein